MKSRFLILTLLSLLAVSVTANAQTTFGAALSPAQEVPANSSSAFGNGTFTLDASRTTLGVSLIVSNLGGNITGAHIHDGAAGTNGPVIINFLTGGNGFLNGRLTANITITAELGARIAANPQGFYANVHTTQFPGGIIRGQLAAASGTPLLGGELKGSNEVPPNSVTTIGAFSLQFDELRSNLTYEINVGNLNGPSAAHIHTGIAGVAGPVVIGFTSATSTFSNGRLKGTVAVPNLDLVTDIIANPQKYYVNVHNSDFPGGVIRDQIANANETDIGVAGKVTNASGQNFVTDVRVFNPSYDTPTIAMLEYFSGASGNTNATSSYVVNVPARGTAVLNDVNGNFYLNSAGVGGLRVTSASRVVVTSNIYNDQRAASGGTFGQFVQGVNRSGALRRGVIPQLTSKVSTPPSGSRTNVGFFNPTSGPVAIRLELRDEGGVLLATSTAYLGAYSQQQRAIGDYFSGLDTTDRPNLTLSFDANAPVVGYGSVVDNVSSDQVYVPAQEDIGVSTAP